ncbi:MAG: glycine cleavage system aminomethyltransferase GcvT [Pararhodobacter sp.]|nr:glycine cleavage system aminomethyltransferase GcvT [Pararhodobacter sp.]
MDDLLHTPLHELHLELGARMVPFAGYAMPVQYPAGVLAEHRHCRAQAALFDVSHMGQIILGGRGAAEGLEALLPADVQGLAPGRQCYGFLTNADGGIDDDLMIANRGDHLFLVVNAARKASDLAHLQANLTGVEPVTDRALLALQGPGAEAALARLVPDVSALRFMDVAVLEWGDAALWISRSGYTGEDGFEISVPEAQALDLARTLLAQPEVAPAGLGARDSLRLEAGLCLYGHDIDAGTSPVEAGLAWAIRKCRRRGGSRAGGFTGAERILPELEHRPARRRVGLLPEGRAPMREGVALFDARGDGPPAGQITSGGFGPTLARPVAMGYLPAPLAQPGTTVRGDVRGKLLPARVVPLPFHTTTYRK